jgi:ketosteroid isomerase-like protein
VLGTTKLSAHDGGSERLTTFTLILRRTAGFGTKWGGWRIVHDHTSYNAEPEQPAPTPVPIAEV